MAEQDYYCHSLQLENLLIFSPLSLMLVILQDGQGLRKAWKHLQNLKNETYKFSFTTKHASIKMYGFAELGASPMGLQIDFLAPHGAVNIFT